jgi:hypothetical protein
MIVITAIIVIGLPVGAIAAISSSNVFITDHGSGANAAVSPGGNLKTASQPQVGSLLMSAAAMSGSDACAFVQVPAGKAFVITEVTWSPVGAVVGADTSEYLELDGAANCSLPLARIAGGSFAQDGVYETTFSPGLGIGDGHYVDLQVSSASHASSQAFVYGYFVPMSQCAGNCH